jgi:predicted nucleotidyltransferase
MNQKLRASSDPTLQVIVQRLYSKIKPKRIYLFGSRARSDHSEDSDYDLVAVIGSSKQSKLERSAKARTAIGSVGAAVDVIVLTEREFEQASRECGSLVEIIESEGREIDLA